MNSRKETLKQLVKSATAEKRAMVKKDRVLDMLRGLFRKEKGMFTREPPKEFGFEAVRQLGKSGKTPPVFPEATKLVRQDRNLFGEPIFVERSVPEQAHLVDLKYNHK